MNRPVPRLRPWQNPRWIATVAFFIFSVSLAAWAGSSIITQRSTAKTLQTVNNQSEVLDRIAETQQRIDRNQQGIDELVAFVHSLPQTQQGQSGTATSLFRILCSITEPSVQTTCLETGHSATGG